MPVSVDTYKSKVAEANLAAGAHLLNDIWGLKADDKMAGVIAKYDAACCLMHNRNEADYKNFMEDMKMIYGKHYVLQRKRGFVKMVL